VVASVAYSASNISTLTRPRVEPGRKIRGVHLELAPAPLDRPGEVALGELQLQSGQTPQRPPRRDDIEVDTPIFAAP